MDSQPRPDRPNVLLLVADQHRYDALGSYGNPVVHSPTLDSLAAGGVQFDTCYVQNPICSPSRASLATGLYPRNHGLWANGVALPEEHTIISRHLADAGYDCGMAGKQHLAACSGGEEPRRDDGYRVYKWSHSPNPDIQSPHNSYHRWLEENHPDIYQAILVERPRAGIERGNSSKGATPMDTVPVEAHYSHWIADETIAFINDASRPSGRPFFFMANFFDPHHPFGAPSEFRSLYDAAKLPGPVGSAAELAAKPRVQAEYSKSSYGGHAPGFADYSEDELREVRASYYAMISLLDHEIERILTALAAAGELDNTLIIYTSDHGEMLGDHALLLKGPMLYDPVVRVPLILNWPRRLASGRRVSNPVQTIDITSTLLEVAGVRDAAVQGESLLPLATGAAHAWRDWALCEYRDSGHRHDPPINTTMLRRGRYKLVIWHGGPTSAADGELYDLDADPHELTNLYHDPRHAACRDEMKDDLLDVLVATEWPRPARVADW